jgi:hypothetical protein
MKTKFGVQMLLTRDNSTSLLNNFISAGLFKGNGNPCMAMRVHWAGALFRSWYLAQLHPD